MVSVGSMLDFDISLNPGRQPLCLTHPFKSRRHNLLASPFTARDKTRGSARIPPLPRPPQHKGPTRKSSVHPPIISQKTMSTADSLPSANGHTTSAFNPPPPALAVPPEIEATLSRLSAYRNVRGVMILSRRSAPNGGASPSIGGSLIQSTGAVFEGEGGRKYAKALEGVVAGVAVAVGKCDEGVSDGERC